MSNTFQRWCIDKNVYTNDTKKCSHLLLNGGKLNITEELYNDFTLAYLNGIQNNEKIYVVEKISNEIKLFIDIDSKNNDKNINIEQLIKRINEILPISNNIYKCNKTNGYHIIYSDRVVDPDEAKKIIEALQLKLVHEYKYNINDIQNIIDTSVYKTGLRMIGSYKIKDYRYYLPEHLKFRNSIEKNDIEKSSIRVGFENYTSKKKNELEGITPDNKRLTTELERLHENYKGIKITKLKKMEDTFVIGTNSKFCMNKNGYHDNHIYFVVTENKKIYQKCFCSNNNTKDRKHGVCSKYKSESKSFGHLAYNILVKSFIAT